MNCADTRDLLPLYEEDELDPAQATNVARHLDACADCRALLELDRALAASLSTLALPRTNTRLEARRARIWARIERQQIEPRTRTTPTSRSRVGPTLLGLVATASLILLLMVLGETTIDKHAAEPESPIPPSRLLLVGPMAESAAHFGIRPVDPATLDDLPGSSPLDFGHHYVGSLSPDGKTLAAFVWPTDVPQSSGVLHLMEVGSGADSRPGITMNDYVQALTFGPDGRSLYWISPVFGAAVHDWPDGLALYRYDLAGTSPTVVTTLPVTFVPWQARALPNGTMAIYGIPTASSNLATDAPHLLLVNLASGQVNADVRLDGIKHGYYSEPDLATGQPGQRMYWPGLAWDLARDWLYVASPDSNRIVVVDLTQGKIVQQGNIHPPASFPDRLLRWLFPSVEAKGGPTTLRVAELSPDGRRLYLIGSREGQTWSSSGLDVVNTNNLTLIRHLDLPASDLALSPDGRRLLLHLSWPSTEGSPEHQELQVLDALRLNELGGIDVDGGFELIGFSPDGRDAYLGRNFERPDRTWQWRISVVDLAPLHIVADRGFTSNGASAFVSFAGVWRNGAWQQEQ